MSTAGAFPIVLALATAAVSGIVGSFALMKRMTLAGDVVSHLALPGLGVAFLWRIHPLIGAAATLAIGIILIDRLQRRSGLATETAIGVVFTAALALGTLRIESGEEMKWTFGAILLVSAILRIGWNDVAAYSPADETVYASYTKTLTEKGFVRGYPAIVRAFVGEPRRWRYPSPLRWGYFALTTFAAEIFGASEPRAIAWLSTIAGLLVVPIVFFLGRRLFDERTALLAAALTAVSPLELALGRRALQDEVFCLAVAASLALVIVALEERRWPFVFAAVAALTLSFGIKESFLYMYPAFLALLLVYRKPHEISRRDAAMFLLPPLFYFLGFAALAHSARDFFRIGRIVTSAMAAPYVVQYQGGPPHRLLFDFLIVSPLVSLLAAGAVVMVLATRERGARSAELALVVFVVVAAAVFAVVPSKNLRFYVMLDPMMRLLAAWVVARSLRPSTLVAMAACNAAIELELFRAIFVQGGVYDPVTQSLLEAVGAVPHEGTPHAMIFPWVCAAIALMAWGWGRGRRIED